MNFHFLKAFTNETTCYLFILGVFEGKEKTGSILKIDKALNGHLREHLVDEEFTGKIGQSIVLHTHGKLHAKKIALLGLGPRKKYDEEVVRRSAGS